MKTRTLLIIIFISILCVCIGFFAVAEKEKNNQLTQIFKIKSVVSATEIFIKNKGVILLGGIYVPLELNQIAKKRLEELLLPSNIIIEPIEKESNFYMVYIWNWDHVGITRNDFLPSEIKGFTNVKLGFLNVQKGVALNVNAFLIREGYATVIENIPSQLFKEFTDLQNLAKREKLGIWSK